MQQKNEPLEEGGIRFFVFGFSKHAVLGKNGPKRNRAARALEPKKGELSGGGGAIRHPEERRGKGDSVRTKDRVMNMANFRYRSRGRGQRGKYEKAG